MLLVLNISSWMTANRLTLNSSKTASIIFFLDLVFLIFVNFAVYILILLSKLLVPSPPPLITQNLITVTRCITIQSSEISVKLNVAY